MHNRFKYLTVGKDDANWGLFLNVVGSAYIKSGSDYPPIQHPSGYYFTWKDGRILKEFQLNYITKGSGILENKFGKFEINSGSVILTLPGEWHRYKPHENTGWEENYIGFEGKIANEIYKQSWFSPSKPVLQLGIREEILSAYQNIFDLVEQERPGFQQIASGMILNLMGTIVSLEKQKGFSGKKIAKVIEEARFEIRKNVEHRLNLEQLAKKHNVGYSHFRQMFKKYTGVSPRQYHLQLKIIRAKELLVSTNKSIKEISNELGFQTIYYFSNMFKKKEGVNPSEFRKR